LYAEDKYSLSTLHDKPEASKRPLQIDIDMNIPENSETATEKHSRWNIFLKVVAHKVENNSWKHVQRGMK